MAAMASGIKALRFTISPSFSSNRATARSRGYGSESCTDLPVNQ